VNRFAAILSLLGLVLLVFGMFMMLRFFTVPFEGGGMSDISPDPTLALRHVAGRDIFSAYVLLLASGLGLTCVGIAMVVGRLRRG
jgi:hypothetical protein